MKKRLFTTLLVLCSMVCLLTTTASAASNIPEGLSYFHYDNYVEIIGYTGTATEIVIPAEIDGLPVTSIRDRAFYSCESLTSVSIPDSVTFIGNYAFGFCSSLSNISIPDGVTSIGNSAFKYCESLTSIEIPAGISSIGDETFQSCESLTSINIPDGVTSIGDSAFEDCSNMESIIIPDSITIFGSCSFRDCKSLKTISIPDGIKEIPYAAFSNCVSLDRVVIPEGVTRIEGDAFWHCTSLTEISLPAGLISLDYGVFSQCSSLKNVDIPDTVCEIGSSAFWNCSSLEYLDIPDGVTRIEEDTFSGCTNLTVSIPSGITEIGDEAFYQCTSLTDVVIPASTNMIYSSAFTGCTALKEFKIEDGNSTYNVVDGLLYHTEDQQLIAVPGGRNGVVTIPVGITRISYEAFCECPYVTEVIIPDTMIRTGAFHGCTSMTTITFPASVCGMSTFPFYNCPSLETVYFEGDNPCPDSPIFGRRKPLVSGNALKPMGDDGIDIGLVYSVTAKAYYPYDNENWTDEEREHCGGNITWIPYDPDNPFDDVSDSAFYTVPVAWATDNGITTGMTDTTFVPNSDCTRGQVVTFLWRAAGCPEPTSTAHPFTDVKEKAFYYKAMLWAVENGITKGMTADTFDPNGKCTRGQVVTFLWRANGWNEPASTAHPFTDVKEGAYYYKAMLWAVENGITKGMTGTTFAPGNTCTRGQVVTFLYRADRE